jgi:hypothetical protein
MQKDGIASSILNRLSHLLNTYCNYLNSSVENARWLVTLVLAEMAGLAGYRHLIGATTLSVPFMIVLAILAMSLVLFAACVWVARETNYWLQIAMHDVQKEILRLAHDSGISQNEMQEKGTGQEATAGTKFLHLLWGCRILEFLGILTLVFGSLAAFFAVFTQELFKLF